MSSQFGKNWISALFAVLLMATVHSTANAQFGSVIQQIGGVWIDPSGVLSEVTEEMRIDARQLVGQNLTAADSAIDQATELRMISLKGLEAALAKAVATDTDLPLEVQYMAGIQRIQYVFVDPENNDIIIAGPGEGWKVDNGGNVVGVTTGRPVIRFEDFIVAIRTAEAANRDYGISVSIAPTEEGSRNLQAFYRRMGQFDPRYKAAIEQAMGAQQISLTGVPTDTRLAQVLVAADYRMKQMAMGFLPSPVADMPSILEIAQEKGKAVKMAPRFWLECNYGPIKKSKDGLSWQLQGSGAKALTENQFVSASGEKKVAKDHPIATQWADKMTDKFAELANADPIFAELQNVMDMAVVAALIQKHDLLGTAGMDISTINGQDGSVALPKWSAPETVSTQCSFVNIKGKWMVTTSGGVQVDSWSVLENIEVDDAVAQTRARASLGSDSAWWNSIN